MKAPGGFHLNKGLELPLFAGIRNHGVCARRVFFRKFEFRCAFKKKTRFLAARISIFLNSNVHMFLWVCIYP